MVEKLPELLLPSVEELRSWLAAHQHDERGVRLVLAKKGAPAPTTLTYDQALLEALCVGWIDGQANRRDEGSYSVRLTPRRSRSLWSRRNVELVAGLTEQGRMGPRGVAEVERARADGRWAAAYAGAADIEVPPALTAGLAAEPAAQAVWEQLSAQNRYAVLHRIHTARRADTRARRIEQFVAMLARGETPHPQQRGVAPSGADGAAGTGAEGEPGSGP